jgi:hypothetical protein
MRPKPTFSAITLICVVALALVKGYEYKRWKHTQIIQQDVISYYAYLPAIIIHKDASLGFVDALKPKSGSKFWYHTTSDNKRVLKMTSGIAILVAPFFLIAHFISFITNNPATGFTSIYELLLFIAAIFYYFLGLLFIRKSLSDFFNDRVIALAILSVGLGTNLLFYTAYDSGMSHVYSFSIISIFLWLSIQWNKKPSLRISILMGLAGGMATLIRPTNAVVFLIPLLWNILDKESLILKLKFMWKHSRSLLFAAFFTFIAIAPQLFYWKYVTGHWFFYSYNDEGFFFNRPHILEGLFGFRKGFFVYAPIMFFIIPGWIFAFRKKAEYSIASFFFFLINIYVIFSWWCWWYGGGLGSRPLIDSFAILSLPLASFYTVLFKKSFVLKLLFFMVISCFIILNIFQIKQFHSTLLHWDSMSARAYVKIFGTTTFPKNYTLLLNSPDYENAKKGLTERELLNTDYYLKIIDSRSVGIKAGNNKYLSADKNEDAVIANRDYLGEWETFFFIMYDNNECVIRSFDNNFLCCEFEHGGRITASRKGIAEWETFIFVKLEENFFALKAANNKYITVDKKLNHLIANSDSIDTLQKFQLVNK